MSEGTGILALPDSVLGRICSQFCPHCVGEDCVGGLALPDRYWGPEYFGTLDALTKVNVRIGRLAQQARLHVFCARRNSLRRLVRTLLEAPALAEHIRVVRLGYKDSDGDERCILRELATREAVQRLGSLAAPEAGAGFDFSSILGEKRLMAKFYTLPGVEDSFVWVPRIPDPLWGLPPMWIPVAGCLATQPRPVRAIDLTAKARLHAFVLFKLAKNITSVAIQSDWPLGLFPATKAPKIIVKQAITVEPGCLPNVEELRLDSGYENPNRHRHPHRHGQMVIVDVRKMTGLLSRVPNLRTLRIRGAHFTFPAEKSELVRPVLTNLTTLDLTSVDQDTLTSILAYCTPANLKHFRFTIDSVGRRNLFRPGDEMRGHNIIDLLESHNFAASLESLHIDTTKNILLASRDPRDFCRDGYETIESLRSFTALRHLSISAENIYFPSGYPRVLLRDPYTGDEDAGQRLVSFLPRNIESVEITGVYAIHVKDVEQLAAACRNTDTTMAGTDDDAQFCFPNLKRAVGAEINAHIASLFREAGVDYHFDRPEFFFDQYAGDFDEMEI
ncbi:uncharacterized protein THITE_112021 [Thermothielavioides terrestris NRRL 8126]|uniref:F-box domain-containing protein n=1 Tax=Thermothielavioides terrestris (strain ATCC 38088 / NRRL 8126) TaxID=578455 RepID=G2R0U6_THETT|nr:uncharacterized protein THITE_112021 [Thermothielavioides terrestris NRRL 8126]AEO64838.1 hypothetical protein THITE_112021 [Thermothielavioides terrestris NRRL 8126]